MDIYHTGADDDPDDHKVVHERLLEVAFPEDHDPNKPLKLEDCLENYFNNKIEVKRNLQRSNTKSSVRSTPATPALTPHLEIETREITWSESPATSPISPGGRHRGASIIQQLTDDDGTNESFNGEAATPLERASTPGSMRKGSKAVMMPAWQFYNLLRPLPFSYNMPYLEFHSIPCRQVLIGEIAWNTVHAARARNDEDVAKRFAMERPVLGVCLKRYRFNENGEPEKNKTYVDIPLDIRLPHFIEEDMRPENDPLMGNFKLSLQSVVCHRGESVNAGHYISFVRGMTEAADGDIRSSRRLNNNEQPPDYSEDRWIKFDDLAEPRVSYVDIEQALRDETPYLLFYQVQPTVEYSLPPCEVEPPSYTDSGIGLKVYTPAGGQGEVNSGIGLKVHSPSPVDGAGEGYFDGIANDIGPSVRFSSELERPDPSRRSMNLGDEDRRGSAAMTESSMASTASSGIISPPLTPNGEIPETTAQRISRATSKFRRSGSKSRPTSASGEGRISSTFQRMNWKGSSKEFLPKIGAPNEPTRSTEIVDQLDGPTESNRNSIAIDEHALKPDDGVPNRSKTRRGRKRDKSKEPKGPSDTDRHSNHLQKGKGKGKEPDRECITM